MAIFRLTTGNERVRLNRREVDTVVVESASRRDTDIVLRFESQDVIDLSAFGGIDAQELIDNAIQRGRRGVILQGDFGRLGLGGITKDNLRPSNFITDGASNAPPIALDDFTSTSENTSVNISVLDNDFDFDNDPVSIIGFDSRSSEGGTIVLSDNGTGFDTSDDFLIYTPGLGFAGSDSFSYTISDGQGNTDTASVSVTVRSGPTPPPPPPPPPPLLPTSVSLARQDQLTGMSASDMLVGNENEDISSDAIEGFVDMGNSLTAEAIDLSEISDPLNNLTVLGTAENAVNANLPDLSTNSDDGFATVMSMIVDDRVIQNVLT